MPPGLGRARTQAVAVSLKTKMILRYTEIQFIRRRDNSVLTLYKLIYECYLLRKSQLP